MCTMRRTAKRIAAGVAAAAIMCAIATGQASGALLLGDLNGMMSDSVYFDTAHLLGPGFTIWAADIEYCVYAPNKFTQTAEFSSETVDPSHYVYAYQIAEVYDGLYGPGYINQFSVGLSDLNEDATNASYVAGTGSAPTSDGEIVTGSAKWVFDPGVHRSTHPTSPPAPSAVLYFTSPHTTDPDWDNATAMGAGFFDTQSMPSPAPEPAAMALWAVCGAMVLRRRRRGS